MRGMLTNEERRLLHETVLEHKPRTVLEIGTWRGGGSTYQIATALEQLGTGVLHTCEIDDECYQEARKIYENDRWKNVVHCHNIPSTQLIQQLIEEDSIPDLVFEDGPEDAELNQSDFLLLEPYLSPGSVFVAHDWDLGDRFDGLISVKSRLLRPYIEESESWKVEKYITAPISVGMVVARRERALPGPRRH